MAEVHYHVVEHDGGWAYRLGDTFSETFPSHDDALDAAHRAAREMRLSGEDTDISFQDSAGHWKTEHVSAVDRPEADVEDDGAEAR
jgi:hypothetical protein